MFVNVNKLAAAKGVKCHLGTFLLNIFLDLHG